MPTAYLTWNVRCLKLLLTSILTAELHSVFGVTLSAGGNFRDILRLLTVMLISLQAVSFRVFL